MSDESHRSHTAWPGPMSVAGVEPGHDHELPAPLLQRVRLLARAVVIFGVCLAGITTLLVLIILERGEQRDREQDELEREIRESWCLALDTLPEGGLLDRLRDMHGCGPGLPFDELTPAEQEQIRGRTTPPAAEPAPAPTAAPPTVGPQRFVPPPPPPAPPRPEVALPRSTPPPEPPLVDLGPITEPVCDALGVCV